jgi:hypothetical protein
MTLDPAYKARREREMAALIAERNRGAGAVLRYELAHDQAPAPVPATRAGDRDVEQLGRVALSSETPIRRQGWFGPDWLEILDHGRGAVRLERTRGGLPMIAEHQRTRLAGVWRDGAVDSDRVFRAVPVFSRNAFGQEVRTDVVDGIRTTTSIGYRVYAAQLEAVDDGGIETWRFTDWEPLEASWEVIPADVTVGVGRTLTPPSDADGEFWRLYSEALAALT